MDLTQNATDRTVNLTLTRHEARDIRDHLESVDWASLDQTTQALFHFLDMALAPSRRPAVPTFPGGGI